MFLEYLRLYLNPVKFISTYDKGIYAMQINMERRTNWDEDDDRELEGEEVEEDYKLN